MEGFSTRTGQYHRPLGEDGFSYRRQVEALADMILKGTPNHGTNIEDGIAAMRALVAIARSVESGECVRLADVIGGV